MVERTRNQKGAYSGRSLQIKQFYVILISHFNYMRIDYNTLISNAKTYLFQCHPIREL